MINDIETLRSRLVGQDITIFDRVVSIGPHGQAQFNPVMAAALIERASLDGDVPELRHGPLPEGGKPAVPVATDIRDPVMIGLMLEWGSDRVAAQLKLATDSWTSSVRQIIEEATATGTSLETVQDRFPAFPVGVEGYQAGNFPALLHGVEAPTTGEVEALDPIRRCQYAYAAIATTQGRRTLAPTIQRLVAERLKIDEGRVLHVLGQSRWSVELHGPEDLDVRFSPVEAAVAALVKDLLSQVKELNLDVVEVIPAADVSSRTFGWIARVGKMP